MILLMWLYVLIGILVFAHSIWQTSERRDVFMNDIFPDAALLIFGWPVLIVVWMLNTIDAWNWFDSSRPILRRRNRL